MAPDALILENKYYKANISNSDQTGVYYQYYFNIVVLILIVVVVINKVALILIVVVLILLLLPMEKEVFLKVAILNTL